MVKVEGTKKLLIWFSLLPLSVLLMKVIVHLQLPACFWCYPAKSFNTSSVPLTAYFFKIKELRFPY